MMDINILKKWAIMIFFPFFLSGSFSMSFPNFKNEGLINQIVQMNSNFRVYIPYVSKPCPLDPSQIEIVFRRRVYPYTMLYGISLDSPCSINLTATSPDWESQPVWSQDGTMIVHGRDGDLFTFNLINREEINITKENLGFSGWPVWSADNITIAYTSIIPGWGGASDIFTVKIDGSERTNVTNHPEYYKHLSWSPDGDQVSFLSNAGLWVMNKDGTDRKSVAYFPGLDSPKWSPTDDTIVFSAGIGGASEIYLINSDGKGLMRLTTSGRKGYEPVWSPNGRKIAFLSPENFNTDIFIMNKDGSGSINITNSPDEIWDLDWSSNREKIAFVKRVDGTDHIFIANTDGSGFFSLTNDSSYSDFHPEWKP